MDSPAADSFMKEVRDNFLLCKLCEKDFNRPKTLPCMHTFCQDCLVSYADDQSTGESKQTYRYSTYCKPISCPVCRRRTDITKDDIDALPDNFLISSLSGIIRDKNEETAHCQICTRRPKGRKPTATKKCLECDKQLCKRCVVQHQETKVTQSHTLYSLENAHRLMCTEHEEEGVRFICKTCSKCVCVFCTHTSHKGHDVMSIVEGTKTCQQELDDTMDICNRRIDSISRQLHFIQTWEQCYNHTKEHIVSTAATFLSQVESQRQSILGKLDELYGAEVLDVMSKKDQLVNSLEGLTGACKFQTAIPENSGSLEAILIQNEVQNKVKCLLDTPSPVTFDQLPSTDMSVSFEQGGLSLGALVKQDDGEDPLYYDADEMEGSSTKDQAQTWCRKCRSRSRSRSRATDMLDRRQGSVLTPFMSDTDLSLTDVSAIGTMSPLFSKSNFDSMASDVDSRSAAGIEMGVQVNANAHCIDNFTQYEDVVGNEMMSSAVPDVVPCARQMTDSSCQYENQETPFLQKVVSQQEIGIQYESSLTESGTQHEISLHHSGTQHDVTPVNSSTQYDVTPVNSSTQHETLLCHSSCQHDVTFSDAACQNEATNQVETGIQYVSFATDIGCQSESIQRADNSSQIDPVATVHSSCQYDVNANHISTQYEAETGTCSTMTDLHFGKGQGLPLLGRNTQNNTIVRLGGLVQSSDKLTMTHPFKSTVSKSTSTLPSTIVHRTTSTDLVQLADAAVDPVLWSMSSRQSQTAGASLRNAGTNTIAVVNSRDAETNTSERLTTERFSQTFPCKMKSRGVNVKPSVAEFALSVKPPSSNTFTNTNNPMLQENTSQTMPIGQTDKTTNTLSADVRNKGVTAHIFGTSFQTDTNDLIQLNNLSTQTVVETNSVAVGSESTTTLMDNSTNTSTVQHSTTASNTDDLVKDTMSIAVGTSPPPSLRDFGVNATQTKSDSWTNPVIQPVSSKACGTDRIKHRNVGLYVRPLSVENATMTQPHLTKDICCGPEVPRQQVDKILDTNGLATFSNKQTNTFEVKKQTRTGSSQTRVVSHSDNYTVMLPSVLVDKSTNTPHQIPQQILDQFQFPSPPPSDLHTRAIQTEWNPSECPTCLTIVDGQPHGMTRNADDGLHHSMLPTNLLPVLSVDVIQGGSVAQPQPSSTAPDCNLDPSEQRQSIPATTSSVVPVMCDQSTNTASLATLLHPDKANTDCMDNKISECIVKLRQVTKKLQKSSTDVTKSETSTLSSRSTDAETSGLQTTSTTSQGDAAASLSQSDSVAVKKLATSWRKRSAAHSNQHTDLSRSVSDNRESNVKHELSNPVCWSTSPLTSKHSAPDRTHSNAASSLPSPRLVRRFSKSKLRDSECGGEFMTSEQDTYTSYDSANVGQESGTSSPRSGSVRQWDLKSLVHEEDRLRRAMRKSTEHLHTLGRVQRRDSSSSMESQPMFSAESSLYGSTESLHQSASNKNVRAPHLECSAGQTDFPTFPSASRPELLSPRVPSSKPSFRGKVKARSKQLQTSALLGNDGEDENEPSKSATETTSVKEAMLAPPACEKNEPSPPTSFVSSVVKKVQSIRPSKSTAEVLPSTAKSSKKDVDRTPSRYRTLTPRRSLTGQQEPQQLIPKKLSTRSTKISESCGHRLAFHGHVTHSNPNLLSGGLLLQDAETPVGATATKLKTSKPRKAAPSKASAGQKKTKQSGKKC